MNVGNKKARRFIYLLLGWRRVALIVILNSIIYFIVHVFWQGSSINQLGEVKEQEVFNAREFRRSIKAPDFIKLGNKVFKNNCRSCHGISGQGGVGPNLIDNYWLNGNGSSKAIYNIIRDGAPDNGMPAWGVRLGKEKIFSLVNIITEFRKLAPR